MRKFSSRIDLLTGSVIAGSILIMLLPFWGAREKESGTGVFWIGLFIAVVTGFLLWLLFGTYYKLDRENLTYHNGPFSGKIPLKEIRKIIKGKTLWIGYRPATALNGLIIKYEKYNEIYISPKDNDSFVAEILKLNPSIEIEE